jgi:glucokinase
MSYLGIDVGATKIAGGLVSNGEIKKTFEIKTKSKAKKEVVIAQVFEVISNLMGTGVKGIGIGVPTVVDDKGMLYETHNIPSWKKLNLKKIVEQKFKTPVLIENDAKCFAIGEKHYGKGKKFRNFACITIGSGLGTGIIINNKIYRGKNGCSGEFGHAPYKDGELENYCTKQFFSKRNLDAREVYEKALKGDAEAIALFEEFGNNLGEALAMVINALAPEAIILGGSISHANRFFKTSMIASLKKYTFKQSASGLKILYSSRYHSGILGAAALFKC